jgi:hypothetical protein
VEKKTKEELEATLQLHEALEKEREKNENKFAIKLIERIVFALVATLALAVVGALIKLVLTQ